MKIIILGCGCSTGAPVIGCNCAVCVSINPKNKRLRSSILIEYKDINILIDCGPDAKQQLLQSNITKIDFCIITHQHYDHISGINELRTIAKQKNDITLFARQEVCIHLQEFYPYIWSINPYKQTINMNPLKNYDEFNILDLKIQTCLIYHAKEQGINNIAIRINNFMYANDLSSIPDESLHYFENLDILILDCKKYKNTNLHIGLEGALEINERFKPKQIILTNMSHELDYEKLIKQLPSNIIPAFDLMCFSI